MSVSISSTVDKELKDITLNGLNNEDTMPCIKFSEAIGDIYGPYVQNKVVIQHIEKLMLQTGGAEIILPGLDDPSAKKMFAAAKMQEENWKDGNNFILILCGFLLKEILPLKNSGISCTDIRTGYSAALDKWKVILKEINVKNRSRQKVEMEMPKDNEMKKKKNWFISCEMDSTKEVKMNGRNELLIRRKKAKGYYYNTKITFISQDSMDEPCDGFLNFDEILNLLEYRLSFFSNRKMKTDWEPVNIVLYSSNINCSAVDEKNYCIMHNVLTKLNFIDLYIGENEHIFYVQVIVATGQIDNLSLAKMNQEGILAVTVENQFELQRLQKAVGGSLIPDFADFLKEKDIGQALSVMIEELTDGIFIAVFKIRENDLNTKTIVVRDITNADVKSINSNTDKKGDIITHGAGVAEFLMSRVLRKYADNFTNIPNLVVRSFSEAMEAFSDILKTAAFSAPEIKAVDDCCLGDLFADFDIEDQSLIIQALDSGMMDFFEEKCKVIQMALDCSFDILDMNKS